MMVRSFDSSCISSICAKLNFFHLSVTVFLVRLRINLLLLEKEVETMAHQFVHRRHLWTVEALENEEVACAYVSFMEHALTVNETNLLPE